MNQSPEAVLAHARAAARHFHGTHLGPLAAKYLEIVTAKAKAVMP